MEYAIALEEEPARTLAVHRFTVDLTRIGDQMGHAFGAVAAFLGAHQVPITGPPTAVYDIGPDGMEAAVGFPVAATFEGNGEVDPFALPPSEVLSTVHTGSYEALPEAYEALRGHAGTIGRALDEERMWEDYLTGPDLPPEEMRTRVVWPLQPA